MKVEYMWREFCADGCGQSEKSGDGKMHGCVDVSGICCVADIFGPGVVMGCLKI